MRVEKIVFPEMANKGQASLPVPADSMENFKVERLPAMRKPRNYDGSKKYFLDLIFQHENIWQGLARKRINTEKHHYKRFIHSRNVPEAETRFVENPFYFHDRSFSYEDNGYGDHYLYGLYAGWPHVLMIDKQGYFTNRYEFLKLSVERHLSHKNSLLSSGSTTQIVSRINKSMATPSVLNLLRPKDPLVRRTMLERHAKCMTLKKDHNIEAQEPYVASINFPQQLPIKMKETDPFPESLNELAFKQHRKRMRIASNPKPLIIIPKARVFTQDKKKIFPNKKKDGVKVRVNIGIQTPHDFRFRKITQKLCKEKRVGIEEMKEQYQNFINFKRTPLQGYQFSLFYQESFQKEKYRGFYDIQPKVETPCLTKMIKDGKFTRRYYLENFAISETPAAPKVDKHKKFKIAK